MSHRSTAWLLVAASIVLVAIGAARFALRSEHGLPQPAHAVVSATASTPAAAAATNDVRQPSPRGPAAESGADAHDFPKYPADQPFEFIRRLAQQAYEGDGEAQYRIAKELDRCNATLSLVRKANDPEAAIWNLPSGWTQTMKERAFAEYQRCLRLMQEDPFADLPQRQGGYTVAYWMSRAADSGQPMALVEKAMGSWVAATGDSSDAEKARREARAMLVKATLSGNPDALLLLGFRMRGSNDPERDLQGAAWMLAGCRAGADCGFDSAIVPISMCYEGGDVQCQPGLDVETMLARALSPAEFAQAHARYERISAALRARDSGEIDAQLGLQP